MDITNIEELKENIFEVTLSPDWFERIFRIKERKIKIKETGNEYTFRGCSVYINHKGKKMGPDFGTEFEAFQARF